MPGTQQVGCRQWSLGWDTQGRCCNHIGEETGLGLGPMASAVPPCHGGLVSTTSSPLS